MTTRISKLSLWSQDALASQRFLSEVLGEVAIAPAANAAASVSLSTAAAVEDVGSQVMYWKYSVFADDVAQLRESIIDAGVEVSAPVQFGDIGYLCHLREPGGNEVELLQRTFQDSAPLSTQRPDLLGLITLRVDDIDASTTFYVDGLGMRLLATMAVDDGRRDPFDLYFFGYVAEDPPNADVASVENREWLYQQSVTLIELQHYRGERPTSEHPTATAGLREIHITVDDADEIAVRLQNLNSDVTRQGKEIHVASPDGHQFVLSQRS